MYAQIPVHLISQAEESLHLPTYVLRQGPDSAFVP